MAYKPFYTLIDDVSFSGSGTDPIKIPSGTVVDVIWNENYIPSHRKEELANYNKNTEIPWVYIVTCGTIWIPIQINKIRINY